MANFAAAPTPPFPLTDEEIDELLAHPYWAPLGDELDRLIDKIPSERPSCERTTILTWIYQQQGVITFLELSDRITGIENVTLRKKQLRATLRGLEKLRLINIVNFQETEDAAVPEEEGVIGRTSLISLTWAGMVWMRRAWQARARLGDERNIARVHQIMVDEEDDGKANEPFWVENLASTETDGPAGRAKRIADAVPAITSVFDLAAKNKRQ
jgi:hypothetical protein